MRSILLAQATSIEGRIDLPSSGYVIFALFGEFAQLLHFYDDEVSEQTYALAHASSLPMLCPISMIDCSAK